MAVLTVPPVDLAYPTLGPLVADFIEERCVFGPGSLQGEPARLDAEKRGLLYRFYELMPRGHRYGGQRRFHRCGMEVRKGLAKTELAAWVSFAELHPEGPVRFDGWDAAGNPVGRPVTSPYIPMMAIAEEQVQELAYGVLKYVIENSPDAGLFDCSLDRILRLDQWGRDDGRCVPVSNAPGARDGARTTFQHFDEPHRMILQRHRDAHETMIGNLSKRQMEDPWSLYTSTAGQPGQGSIEEQVRRDAEDIAEGKRSNPRLFFFARWAGPEHADLSTVEKRVAAIAEATGPVGEWGAGQFERIAEDYDRQGTDRAFWERIWLNRWRQSGAQAFDMTKINPNLLGDEPIPPGAFCTLGFDGARFRDATALVLTEIYTGKQQCLAFWEREDEAGEWEVDEVEVTAAWEDAFSRYEIHAAYADPPHWTETIAGYAARWPDQVTEWWTNRPRAMAFALRAYMEAHDSGSVTYVAEPKDVVQQGNRMRFLTHLANSGKKLLKIADDEGKPLYVLQKMDGRLTDRIDIAMAGVLSWQATIDARREGAQPRQKVGLPRRLY